MNKIKYLAAVLIGVAGLGLHQAKAYDSTLNALNISGYPGPYGSVHIDLVNSTTASVTFTAAAGYELVDGSIADLNVNASSFTVTNLSSDFSFQTGSQQVDGWGRFNLTISAQNAATGYHTVTFTLTNTSGTWASADDVLTLNNNGYQEAAHVRVAGTTTTAFATEVRSPNGVPDGGTTVMLLGMALGALGMTRRYLKS
jgi:protein with PEP-CTERM/exosortase system signal